MPKIVYIIIMSITSIIVLFILTKLMGNRQMSQLSMFDYINGITIGSIAAEMATSLEDDFLLPLTAMIIYAGMAILFSLLNNKSIVLRRILTGKSLILLEDGKLYEANLKKAHLDINEFLTQCRTSGYFDISELQTAILESNGKISFLEKSQNRTLTPQDIGITTPKQALQVNVIIDGHVMEDNLKYTGNDIKWLKSQLHAQKISDIEQIFLATCDCSNQLQAYIKINKPLTRDCFE